jgi:D-alanine transaminase
MMVYLNGKLIDETAACISFDDRGFLFADGVYEVVHIYSRQFFEWDRHMARLQRSLEGIYLPHVDNDELTQGALTLLDRFDGDEGMLYLQITRGVHPRSHAFPPQDVAPTILMWIRPHQSFSAETIQQGVSVITVADDRWAKVWIKTIGLLPNVLAKEKAHKLGVFDAVFVRDGMVTEATSANIFIVRQGVLQTHPVTNYILPGITREVVLELARDRQMPISLEPFSVEEMYLAEEVFLTGTTTEILPVTQVDNKRIGTQAGGVSVSLLEALRQRAYSVS